jgi:hypothetical protein
MDSGWQGGHWHIIDAIFEYSRGVLMDIEALKLTVAIDRFSQLISSTQPQPLRLASTSSRYIPTATAAACIVEEAFLADVFSVPCPRSSIILHGRQVPWLLHNHYRLLTCPNRCHLRRLLDSSLPTNRW